MTREEFSRALQQLGGLGGQHWNSGSQIYGNPLGQSGSLGAQGLAGQAYSQLANAYAQQNSNALAAQQATIAQQGTRKPLKHEGIRAGEIIGYRCWRLLNEKGFLHSLTQMIAWAPGETMQGNIPEYGVYAFNLMGRALGEMEWTPDAFIGNPRRMVTGSVQMWGEIIEHEFGYRSEFAKIVSLDYIQGADESVLQALRVKYGL